MYTKGQDVLLPLTGLPPCDIGAPTPCVVAREGILHLLYYTSHYDPAWDGACATIVDASSNNDPVAIVTFEMPLAHIFSRVPDEETVAGHPLAALDLEPYTPYEVRNSSWIQSLEAMRAVNPYHWRGIFDGKRHFLFIFHDSSFECVAAGYRIQISHDSVAATAARLAAV